MKSQKATKPKVFINRFGEKVRLTIERQVHILEHPEMKELLAAIQETVAEPDAVVLSRTDVEVQLSFRHYPKTPMGAKYLCVASKHRPEDAFIITAYLTDRIKKGEIIWPKDK